MSDPLRILVIEDSEDDSLLIIDQIERNGYPVEHRRVETVPAMQQALDEGNWDAVISDHSLPQLNAPTALEMVQEAGLDVPFIVVSGRIEPETAVDCMRAGAHDYIMKDDLTRLVPALERELQEARERRKRREAEQALQHSERRYRAVFENTGTAMCIVEADKTVALANRQFAEALDLPLEEIEGTLKFTELVADHEVQRMSAYHDARRQTEGGVPRQYEFHYVRADGEHRCGLLTADLIPGTDRTVASLMDITDRKRAEQQREESLRELSLVKDVVVQASRMDDVDEICQLVADRIQAAMDDSHVAVSLYDQNTSLIRIRAVAGDQRAISTIVEALDRPLTQVSFAPDGMGSQAELYTSGRLEQIPGGLHAFMAGKLRRDISTEVSRRFGLHTVYTVGFALEDQPYGGITIFLPEGRQPECVSAIETIASHISVLMHRRQAEQARQQSEQRYRALFQNTGTATCLVQEDGTIRLANEQFVELAGYPREEIEGRMKYTDCLPSYELERITRHHRRRREDGGDVPTSYEFDFINRSGETRRILLTVDMMPNMADSVSSLLDITERKRAEEALRQSEERFRTLVDMLPQVVFECDADGTITFANRKAFELFGYTREDLKNGLNAVDMMAPEDRERVAANIQARTEGRGTPRGKEYIAVKKDGARFPVLVYASPFLRADGEAGLRGIIIDTTERKEAEKEIRRLSQFQQAIIEQANIWLAVWDPDDRVLIWNRAAEQISGYSAQEVIGSGTIWQRLFPDAEYRREVDETAIAMIHEGGKVENYTTPIQTKDGDQRIISWNARTLVDSDGEPLGSIALGRDVTEYRKLQQQLLQSQKIEAVGELAGGVAHDFNNILQIIVGQTELLELQIGADDEAVHESIRGIREAAMRSADLTHQLLAFSRGTPLSATLLDLNELIRNVAPMLKRTIEEDIRLSIETSPGQLPIEGDETHLQQVLVNLVVNARDAMPEGGTIEVATETVALDATRARIFDIEPGEYAAIHVCDNGIGMNDATQSRAFEPFFTTKEDDRGTGLGLSTAYGVVRQSGGHIGVDSTPGAGTTFTVYLPKAAEKEIPPPEPPPHIEYQGGSERVLVVEDDDAVRDFLNAILTRQGYEVIAAENGVAATQKVEELEDGFDLLLTDVVMPKVDGVQLAKKLQETYPDLPVLYMSGYSARRIPEGTTFLQKPIAADDLLMQVREILDRREDTGG